jgi:hypothetical protein
MLGCRPLVLEPSRVHTKPRSRAAPLSSIYEPHVQTRYFTHQELHELFKITPEGLAASETQQLLRRMHREQRGGDGGGSDAQGGGGGAGGATLLPMGCDESLRGHMEWVEASANCVGTSDHGALFGEPDPEGERLERAGARAARRGGGAAGAGGGGLGGGAGPGGRRRLRGGGGGGGGGGGAGASSVSLAYSIGLETRLRFVRLEGAAARSEEAPQHNATLRYAATLLHPNCMPADLVSCLPHFGLGARIPIELHRQLPLAGCE